MPHTGLGLKEGLLNVSGDSLLLFSFLEERWLRPVMSESALVSSAELIGVGGGEVAASRSCVESFPPCLLLHFAFFGMPGWTCPSAGKQTASGKLSDSSMAAYLFAQR